MTWRSAIMGAAALVLVPLTAAYAATVHRITFDPGGSIMTYISRYIEIQQNGTRVVIDGMCISACTLVAALVDDDRVCVTPRARLAFHSATAAGAHHNEATRLMWHMYPPKLRALLIAKGWDGQGRNGRNTEHAELIYIEGDELRAIYRDCAPEAI